MLTRCGKNLLPKLEPQSNSLNGLSYTIDDDGVMTVTGTTTANVNIPIHGTYAAVENVFPGLRAKELFALNVTVRITNPETETNRYQGGAITLVDDEFISYVYMTWPSGSTYSSQKYYPSITLGHAAPAYEPYRSSTTYTLDFGQTVYGGKVDWNKGEMVVDRGYVAFNGTEPFGDGGDVWYLNASYAPGIELGFLNANPNAKAYCSHFAQGNGGINDPNSVGKFDLGGSIRFNKSGFATVAGGREHGVRRCGRNHGALQQVAQRGL